MTDHINHPKHYCFSIEVIDAIESWGLGYHLGNVVKYVARAAHKGNVLTDLQKARWYLDREIAREAAKGVKLSSEECELMERTGLAYLAGSDVADAGGVDANT